MDEDELRKDQHRGQQAKALLENKILKEAFEKVESECHRLWAEAKNADVREGMWLRLQSLEHTRNAIEGIVKKGDLSERKLKELITGKKSVF